MNGSGGDGLYKRSCVATTARRSLFPILADFFGGDFCFLKTFFSLVSVTRLAVSLSHLYQLAFFLSLHRIRDGIEPASIKHCRYSLGVSTSKFLKRNSYFSSRSFDKKDGGMIAIFQENPLRNINDIFEDFIHISSPPIL